MLILDFSIILWASSSRLFLIISTWKSPVCSNNVVVQDLEVKARQKILLDRQYTLVGNLFKLLLLSCAYFTPERCGLSFEIVDLYCKEGEPKEEWVPPPLNVSDEVEVFSEQM